MATVPTQIRIDENLKKQANELFSQLGMDMSSAMNIFLRQCVLRGGLPFNVELPHYKTEVLEAKKKGEWYINTYSCWYWFTFGFVWYVINDIIV